jgi:S1-C subfamily serine protease
MSPTGVLTELSNQMADAVDSAARYVLQVRSRRWRPAAGVVFAEHHVLVADHAVEQDEDVTVRTHDGRVLAAAVAGRDPSSDLAVLEVADLTVQPAVPSPASARVGQVAIAVGRSWSGAVIAGFGVVSSVGGPWRTGRGPGVEQVIRTDIAPYAGFTGGALLAPDGSLLGVASGILLRGLSLAIPAAIAWPLADGLAQHGGVRRAFLGVAGQPVRLSETQHRGVRTRGILVVNVSDGGPAHRAGLMVGDVLLSLNGQPVEDPDALLSLLTADLVDRPVPVEILRAGTPQTVEVTPQSRETTARRRE